MEERRKAILAEVDALGTIDDETLAAFQDLKAEEAQLQQRLLDREITEDEYFTLWSALRKRTSRDVQIASLKITKTITEALRKDSSMPEA